MSNEEEKADANIDPSAENDEQAVAGERSFSDNRFLNEFGFNIYYDKVVGKFYIKQEYYRYYDINTDEDIYSWERRTDDNLELSTKMTHERPLAAYNYDYQEYNDHVLAENIEKYGSVRQKQNNTPVEFVTDDFYEALMSEKAFTGNTVYGGLHGNYSLKNGTIKIHVAGLSEENREKAGVFAKVYDDMVKEGKFNAFAKISLITTHELQHSYNARNFGTIQNDLPLQYRAKIDMLDEISANMSEAGLALDMYRANGTFEYFDNMGIDMTEVKEKLQQNPQMENPEGYVAAYVYTKWLETNNKPGTDYSEQALRNSRSDVLFALDGQEALDRYHERVAAMFEHIEGLGDVRQYVNPDFELNDSLKHQLDRTLESDKGQKGQDRQVLAVNPNLKAMMKQNADNAEQYSKNLMAYLDLVKKVDADGYRTDEENALLNAYMKEHMAPQKDSDTQSHYYANIGEQQAGNPENASTLRLKALIRSSAENAEQYYQNIMNYLDMAKKFDADGVRTAEEEALLDAYVAEHTTPQQNEVASTDNRAADNPALAQMAHNKSNSR